MLRDALGSRQRQSTVRINQTPKQPWFIEAERLCQTMIYQGTTQAIAQPANDAERVAVEKAKSILGIK